MLNWNVLGILLWVILILYLVFVVQNIRKRHIKMIIQQHRRFSWVTLGIDIAEIVILLFAACWMFNRSFLDNPDLENKTIISAETKYQPLILTPASKNSYYVTMSSAKRKIASQNYTFYSAGHKVSVSSSNATIADGKTPLNVDAQKTPYSLAKLKKMDHRYQRAYVATYTATYLDNWQNGIGLHANHVASRYYLIRVPDQSFVRQK